MCRSSMTKAGSKRCKQAGLMLAEIRKGSHAQHTQILQSCWKPQLPIVFLKYHKKNTKDIINCKEIRVSIVEVKTIFLLKSKVAMH